MKGSERPRYAAMLREARLNRGMTSEKAAAAFNIANSTYRRIEAGYPSTIILKRLEHVFPDVAEEIRRHLEQYVAQSTPADPVGPKAMTAFWSENIDVVFDSLETVRSIVLRQRFRLMDTPVPSKFIVDQVFLFSDLEGPVTPYPVIAGHDFFLETIDNGNGRHFNIAKDPFEEHEILTIFRPPKTDLVHMYTVPQLALDVSMVFSVHVLFADPGTMILLHENDGSGVEVSQTPYTLSEAGWREIRIANPQRGHSYGVKMMPPGLLFADQPSEVLG